jgi:hypothetical protein
MCTGRATRRFVKRRASKLGIHEEVWEHNEFWTRRDGLPNPADPRAGSIA